MAYEQVLLERAGDKAKRRVIAAAQGMLPVFVQHALWRPKAREVIGRLMHETDIRMLREDIETGIRNAQSLGLDVGELDLPI
jgi:hypothetical protein